MIIDWQAVEAGDVVEFRDGDRLTLPGKESKEWEIDRDSYGAFIRIHGKSYDSEDIRAIHKPGTVGALSHEERSRLWDAMGEHLISVYYAKPNLVEAFTDGSHATGETPLEAVAKCVAAIEQQQACERHARGE